MKFEEEKPKLRQELRDLIIRNFQMRNNLAIFEVKELLEEIPELAEPDPLSGKPLLTKKCLDCVNAPNCDWHMFYAGKPLLTKKCPDCKTEMRHSSDYSHHWIDIFVCSKCGCRIEVMHGRNHSKG